MFCFSLSARLECPIPDFSIPADPARFRERILNVAERLQDGQSILVHCAAGVGRSGTAAISILQSLGLDLVEATAWVKAAGSGPETDEQRNFLKKDALRFELVDSLYLLSHGTLKLKSPTFSESYKNTS